MNVRWDSESGNKTQTTLEVGRLLGEIQVKPKNQSQPDTDEPLEGAAPSSNSQLQRTLDKLMKQSMAGDAKAMAKMRQIKKEARQREMNKE